MKRSLPKLSTIPDVLLKSVSQTKASYRRLGNSGLRVSNPILGGAHLGSSRWLPWVLEEAKALEILKSAYDRGINTWDTANSYSNGESERIMGKALSKFNIPRRKVVLMTKCYRVVCDSEHFDPGATTHMHHRAADQSKDYVNNWGLSRTAIYNSVEASLERLNTSYIDVLQIHRFDPTVAIEETMSALHDVIKAGLVRYIGASSMWTYQFAMMQHVAEKNGWTKFISMQNHYNLLYREEEREMNDYCRSTGVGIIPWAPLASGRLARPVSQTTIRSSTNKGALYELGDDVNSDRIVERVEEVAKRKGWPIPHVPLAWLNKRVVSPVIGFSSAERIDEALEGLSKVLTEEEEHYLEELYRPQVVQGHK